MYRDLRHDRRHGVTVLELDLGLGAWVHRIGLGAEILCKISRACAAKTVTYLFYNDEVAEPRCSCIDRKARMYRNNLFRTKRHQDVSYKLSRNPERLRSLPDPWR
ncbi:uncharacterized protein LOC143215455 [Lasioglossum baleicum]|uniref:uncharacterized protein LOC143215455 n=1 Tax=Lasioglossum baleicum TaxID=434251 RepID=UPI003FCCC203